MRWRTERREASAPLLVLASFFLVVGSVCWYFWSQQALGSLYYVNVVWPSQHYGTVNQVGYALGIFHEYWRGWAFQPGWLNWSTAMASILVIPLLYVAVLPLIVSMLLLTKARRALGPAGSLYLACGVAMWISESHRHDIYHLVFGSPLLVIVSLHLLSNLKGRGVSWAVQGLAVTAGCLAAVNLLSACTAKTVPTRAGVVGLYKNDGLIAALQARVQRGDKIFVYPYRPIFYFLTRTVNPTRFLTLTYNYNTTEEFQDAIRSLEESRVRYVAWDQNFQAKVAPVVFSPAAMHPPSGFLMEDYLRSHYHAVSDIDGVVLMERNGDITLH